MHYIHSKYIFIFKHRFLLFLEKTTIFFKKVNLKFFFDIIHLLKKIIGILLPQYIVFFT
jgi:hypothetical protein